MNALPAVTAFPPIKPAHVSAIEQDLNISTVQLCGFWADTEPYRMREMLYGLYAIGQSRTPAVNRELVMLVELCATKHHMENAL